MKNTRILLIMMLCGLILATVPLFTVPHTVEAATITVTTTDDEINSDGDCSLREAIQAANTDLAVDACPAGDASNVDTITLANGATYTLSLSGAGEENNLTGDLDILGSGTTPVDLTINVAGGGTATLDANSIDRILQTGANQLTISNITFIHGSANNGGAIANYGSLTLNAVTLRENTATGEGGAIRNYASATLTLQNNSEVGLTGGTNTAADGGGIYNTGIVNITQSSVSFNTANANGGGIYTNGGTVTLTDSTMMAGYAPNGPGGGIAAYNGATVTLNNTDMGLNQSLGGGGAIYSVTSTIVVQAGSTLGWSGFQNVSGAGGGIAMVASSTLTLDNSTVSYNVGNAQGGGIWVGGATMTASASTISHNSSAEGGAFWIQSGGTVTIQNNSQVISNSTSGLGGGFYNTGTLTITDSIIGDVGAGNSANQFGGAIYITDSALLNSVNTKYLANTANNGGAIYNTVDTVNRVNVTNSCLVDNGDTAFYNSVASSQNATGNWWGASNGPGAIASGSGDTVSTNVDYSSHLTSTILGCPSKTIPPTATPTATDLPPTATFTPSMTACALVATAPNLISPVHRAHTTDKTPSFSWSNVNGDQSYRIMVYLEDRSFEFKKRVFVTNYTMTTPLAVAKYLWRVRTQDAGCSTWTGWSQRNTLFVD